MLIVISPSKTLETYNGPTRFHLTNHRFNSHTKILVNLLQNKSKEELASFMSLSPTLAEQNFERYQKFYKSTNSNSISAAILTFKGEVYNGLQADTMSDESLSYANDHLRILSGLYGNLRPTDKIVPYRLEMGSRLKTDAGTNLYHYWTEIITASINDDLRKSGSKLLANLASNEYFKVLNTKDLKAKVINFDFYEMRNGKRTFVSFSAKKARGLMASYIIHHKIKETDNLVSFNSEGYKYDEEVSKPFHLVFTRFAE